MSLVTLHARHALVRAVTTASLALFQTFWLGQHVSPNVQVECSTVRPLILVNCATQLVKHVADLLLVTASLVKLAGCLMDLNAKHLAQVESLMAVKAVRVAILCVMYAMVQVRKTALVAVK